jgi:L-cysteine:1D-myo-inositol 2-amino-2-deoxy-alpha-D-glucopyranoside ligase
MEHYQKDRMWSDENIRRAQALSNKIESALSRSEVAPTQDLVKEIVDSLADNLDTPRAYAAIEKWCDRTADGEEGGSAGEVSRTLDSYLGLAF